MWRGCPGQRGLARPQRHAPQQAASGAGPSTAHGRAAELEAEVWREVLEEGGREALELAHGALEVEALDAAAAKRVAQRNGDRHLGGLVLRLLI